MKLSDYFDKIFIIGGLNSPKVEHTIESLKSLGLYDENVMVYLYLPLGDINIQIKNNNSINDRTQDRISLTLSHYSIIKHSYNAGLNRILILEDDNYFLNDISKWEEIFNNLPDDWDVIRFSGYILGEWIKGLDFENKLFKAFDFERDIPLYNFNVWGASAYALNKNAMEAYLKSQEKFMRMCDETNDVFIYSHYSDYYQLYESTHADNNKLNKYFANYSLFCPIKDIEKTQPSYNYVEIDKTQYI